MVSVKGMVILFETEKERQGDAQLMKKNDFTKEEQSLISIYNPGSRSGLINSIEAIRKDLTETDAELDRLTASVLAKVRNMTDAQFSDLKIRSWFEEG